MISRFRHACSVFLIGLLVTALLPMAAMAAGETVTVSGSVKNDLGSPIAGAQVDVLAAGTTTVITSSPTDSLGAYAVQVASGTYDFRVVPPAGSQYATYVSAGQVVTANKTLDFVLVRKEQGPVTLSGRVTNAHGPAIPGLPIRLSGTGATITVLTDADGRYSFTVAPGQYDLFMETQEINPAVVAAPSHLVFMAYPLSLTESRTLDIALPLAKVNVLVKDQQGNPIPNATVNTNSPEANLPNSIFGTANAAGRSGYEAFNSKYPVTTDAAGRATLWLFPNRDWDPYIFSVATGSMSGGLKTSITGDTDLTLTIDNGVVLSGRVLNPKGQALPGQQLVLTGEGTYNAVTDQSGAYEFRVPSGSYKLEVSGNNSLAVPAPREYKLIINNLTLTESRTFDIPLPVSEVKVHVQDDAGNALAGIPVKTFFWTSYSTARLSNHSLGDGLTVEGQSVYYDGPKTDANGNATVWLMPRVAGSTYPVGYYLSAVPATEQWYTGGSVYTEAESDQSLTITMLPKVTLSGVLRGLEGDPLPGQTIRAWGPNGQNQSYTTDAAGRYTFSVSPGIWGLNLYGTNNGNVTAPNQYEVRTAYTTVSGDRTLDITLPAERVTVRVRDTAGTPVPGVALSTPKVTPTVLPKENFDAALYADPMWFEPFYPAARPVITDANGEATLWLFPNASWMKYGLYAAPPASLPFLPFTKEDLVVPAGGNVEVEIVLQYSHPAPVTTATVQGTKDEAGAYLGSATVTLRATAAAGYTVAATYYQIDDGPVKTYTGAFRLTEPGTYVIRYWSKDNTGVTESAKYLTLTVVDTGVEPPTVTPEVSPAANEAGWHNGDVTVTWLVENAVTTTGCDPVTLTEETAGTTLTCSAANAEGVEASATVTVRIDRTAPVTLATVDSDYGVTLTATDNLSGVRTTYYQVDGGAVQEGTHVTAPSAGSYTVTYWSADVAGNVEAPQTLEVVQEPDQEPVQGFITGGGTVVDGKLKVTHAFTLQCDPAQGPNKLEVNWGGNRFQLTSLTAAACSTEGSAGKPKAGFNTYKGTGTGELNGVEGATVEFTITDNGEPGTKDTFSITIRDKDGKVVLQISGRLLKGGNHQAHDK